jgi:hypothetical protein
MRRMRERLVIKVWFCCESRHFLEHSALGCFFLWMLALAHKIDTFWLLGDAMFCSFCSSRRGQDRKTKRERGIIPARLRFFHFHTTG